MGKRARQLYLRKLDRESNSFGFYDGYMEYIRIKEINRQKRLSKLTTKCGWLEKNNSELKNCQDIIDGYC